MTIKGVLFDKDGTLIDVTGTWVPAYQQLLNEVFADRSPAEIEAKFTAAGFDPVSGAFRAGSVLAQGTTRDIVDIWWPGLDAAGVSEKVRLLDIDYRDLGVRHLKALMPLRPVLAELRAMGLKLGVATNDTAGSAVLHMRALDAADLFDIILGADSVARPKPSGDMIHAFADAVGIEASEVAMVGDNPHDMETAHDAGAGLAIGVLSGNSAHDHLAPLADHVIASIAGLPRLIKGLS
ncbi:HAD family hydrolase [Taklimakanibacter lacteus]|uniref:HAD family hydrolase n=1 Tax=Taklimakanibacter lacteus TaxID=2268456 RepID=UPI000E66E735